MPEAKVTFLLNNLRIAYVLCYQPNHPSLNTQIWLIHRLYMPALILYVYFNIRSGFSIHVSMQMAPIILRAVYIKHTYIRKKYVSCFLGVWQLCKFVKFGDYLISFLHRYTVHKNEFLKFLFQFEIIYTSLISFWNIPKFSWWNIFFCHYKKHTSVLIFFLKKLSKIKGG